MHVAQARYGAKNDLLKGQLKRCLIKINTRNSSMKQWINFISHFFLFSALSGSALLTAIATNSIDLNKYRNLFCTKCFQSEHGKKKTFYSVCSSYLCSAKLNMIFADICFWYLQAWLQICCQLFVLNFCNSLFVWITSYLATHKSFLLAETLKTK